MATKLSDLVQRKMEAENLSLRAAGREADVAHTTIVRILNEDSVDFETIEKVCDWLGVPVTTVIDVREDSQEVMDQIVSVLALSPELAGVFSELAEKVISGEVDPSVLSEVAAFTSYRLHSPLYGDKVGNEQRNNENVLQENREDSRNN